MSLQLLHEIFEDLPPTLMDQIVGYASSVRSALPEIFQEARLRYDDRIADQIILLAGIKKLYTICSTVFWTVENSLENLARTQIHSFRIGGQTYHRQSEFYENVRNLLRDLENLIRQEDLEQYIKEPHYTNIVRALADERR